MTSIPPQDDPPIWVGPDLVAEAGLSNVDEATRKRAFEAFDAARPELVTRPSPDDDGRLLGTCSRCAWVKLSFGREVIENWFAAHTCAGQPGYADDNTQDVAYWKATAEGWHTAYLAALDERDQARAERNKLQRGQR